MFRFIFCLFLCACYPEDTYEQRANLLWDTIDNVNTPYVATHIMSYGEGKSLGIQVSSNLSAERSEVVIDQFYFSSSALLDKMVWDEEAGLVCFDRKVYIYDISMDEINDPYKMTVIPPSGFPIFPEMGGFYIEESFRSSHIFICNDCGINYELLLASHAANFWNRTCFNIIENPIQSVLEITQLLKEIG